MGAGDISIQVDDYYYQLRFDGDEDARRGRNEQRKAQLRVYEASR